jgi:hypothetical protein
LYIKEEFLIQTVTEVLYFKMLQKLPHTDLHEVHGIDISHLKTLKKLTGIECKMSL